ncbi:MAG: alpha/beta fold hydrolase [Nitrospinaceae bacterium]|jgi:3-oxoadipate enol-lactonase|nr:alpha/beta fold hydrolase [Nitrospinaceae bacterium]MBT3434644.1 alpha/beta fold hydrolase [Nitrospinaceae bacterium]MBT4093974.1 alpha/beta fold hydrolase [Nitrospinaceae bacterium]MBT4431254.1 alpha/beta fold hydrolase [Nitrospinaceae bacterium]MBT5366435.1 alpha/beta fold hydrolase [Nitrospinaceae bacterium]
MPKTTVGDVELYYEESGAGTPVVLIHGLAGDCSGWQSQIKVLEKNYRVIALDNRGAGRSSAPDYPYTTRHFADDTIGLMDALGVSEPAHVIGRSMGGAIAQEMAINYPGRVRSMLITASFGKLDRYGYQILYNFNEVVKAQGYPAAAKHQSLFFFPPLYFNENQELLDAFEAGLGNTDRPIHGYSNSTNACLTHDALDRLGQVKCPTYVLAGGEDVLCSVGAARQIAERVPGSRIKIYEDASHFFLIQCFEESMTDIKYFLDAN